jgi:transketolase
MYISEQQMVAAAVGLQVRGWVPYASSFACFLTRAYDFIRMGAVSRASIRLCGSHAGVSIGEDGPSQMALEDIAAFRAIHGSTVLHPSDANQTAQLVAAMADRTGISFLRTLRGKTPVRTPADETVRIGGSRVAHEGDDVAIVACGITVDEAVRAAERAAGGGPRRRFCGSAASAARAAPAALAPVRFIPSSPPPHRVG